MTAAEHSPGPGISSSPCDATRDAAGEAFEETDHA
jgi:hypothetical protein